MLRRSPYNSVVQQIALSGRVLPSVNGTEMRMEKVVITMLDDWKQDIQISKEIYNFTLEKVRMANITRRQCIR